VSAISRVRMVRRVIGVSRIIGVTKMLQRDEVLQYFFGETDDEEEPHPLLPKGVTMVLRWCYSSFAVMLQCERTTLKFREQAEAKQKASRKQAERKQKGSRILRWGLKITMPVFLTASQK
jgi:hypothetical protein